MGPITQALWILESVQRLWKRDKSVVPVGYRTIPLLSDPVYGYYMEYVSPVPYNRRSQWPRGLRRRSLAARLLRLWVRIPPGAWINFCCECCVLSGRGLCDGLIIRSEESYRLWRVVVCDQETSQARRLKLTSEL